MMSQVDDESDDEYLDDPIKLFDLEEDRVHFGSLSHQYGIHSNNESHQSKDEVTHKNDPEFLETPENSLDDFNKSNCTPLCVKLVNCEKFPWYFKKYTQQILNQTKIYDLVSESDHEEEIAHLIENNDCFVLDNITNELKRTQMEENNYIKGCLSKSFHKIAYKSTAEKRQETMKRREDLEKQIALNKKNASKVDFKRNKGLIGMTITQKVVKNTQLNTLNNQIFKAKEKLADYSYIRAADKILCNIGTELIPVSEDIETDVSTKVKVNTNEENEHRSEKFKKMPVQFSLGKISKQLLQRITTHRKINTSHCGEHENNEYNKEIHKQKPNHNLDTSFNLSDLSNKSISTARNVKNIKKTNMYKNCQIKAMKKIILEIQSSELSRKSLEKGDVKNASEDVDLNQSANEIVEDIREPNSPILPCSTLPKKNRDTSENFKHSNTNNFNDKQKGTDKNFNTIENGDNPSKDNNKNKDLMFHLKQDSNDSSLKFKNKKEEIGQIVENEELSEKNNKNTDNIVTRQNKIPAIQNFTPNGHEDSNNLNIQIISVKSIATPRETTNCDLASSDKDALSVIDCQSDPMPVTNNSNIITQQSNNSKQNSSVLNVSITDKNIYNPLNCIKSAIDMVIDDAYTLDKTLNSNNPVNSQNTKPFSQPILERRPPKMSVPIQPQHYQSSYSVNYHTPLYCGINKRLAPRSANSATQNYRFPPPRDNRHRTQFNPIQYNPALYNPSFYNSWQQSNFLPMRNGWPSKDYSYQIPMTQPQTPQCSFSTRFGIVPRPKNIPQDNIPRRKNISQLNNSSKLNNVLQPDRLTIIARNNKNAMKDSIDILPASQNSEQMLPINQVSDLSTSNSELVTSKAKMLEVLDNATNTLKRACNDNYAILVPEQSVNTFKRPKIIKRTQTAPTDDHSKEIEQQKGYSDPILPIPTYENFMDHVMSDLRKRHDRGEEPSNLNNGKRNNGKKLINGPQIISRKRDTKKISLEEYKRRTIKMSCKNDRIKECKNKYDKDKKRLNMQNKSRENVNRFSTESDLGYDSDSTIIL